MTLTSLDQRTDACASALTELELWEKRADGSARRLDLQRQAARPWAVRGRAATAWWRFAHPPVAVPDGWPLEEARLDVDLGGEGLMRIAYSGGGDEEVRARPEPPAFPAHGRRFAVSAECVARLPFGVPNARRLARWRPRPADPASTARAAPNFGATRHWPRCAGAPPHQTRRPRGGDAASASPRRRSPGSTGRPPPPPMSRAWRRARKRSGSGSCRSRSRPAPAGLGDAARASVGEASGFLRERLRSAEASATRRTARSR